MAKQYKVPETEPMMVKEDATPYPHGITIPVDLPTTGGYSVEYLKRELTDFAMKLLRRPTEKQASHTDKQKSVVSVTPKEHSPWVQSMAKFRRLAPMDSKQAMLDSLDERFG